MDGYTKRLFFFLFEFARGGSRVGIVVICVLAMAQVDVLLLYQNRWV